VQVLDLGSELVRYAESGAGPLAVFVHGGGLDHQMWDEQLAALGDARRCVAIDLPGAAGPLPRLFNVCRAIEALGSEPADLVGHSWGGHEVLAAWRSCPARIRSIALLGVMFSATGPARPGHGHAPALRPVPIEEQVEVVRSISVPLLVATGDRDQVTPPALCRMLAASNPRGAFVEVAGAGHMSPLEKPQAVNAALRALWYD
jgi:pimeloyl-ACP methyl ester carboxylesterase